MSAYVGNSAQPEQDRKANRVNPDIFIGADAIMTPASSTAPGMGMYMILIA